MTNKPYQRRKEQGRRRESTEVRNSTDEENGMTKKTNKNALVIAFPKTCQRTTIQIYGDHGKPCQGGGVGGISNTINNRLPGETYPRKVGGFVVGFTLFIVFFVFTLS